MKDGAMVAALILAAAILASAMVISSGTGDYPGNRWIASPEDVYEASQAGAVVIDASSKPVVCVEGAVNLPSLLFLDGERKLRPTAELAGILGEAGISENDSVVVYGCTRCGEDTFVFWVLRYLGHERVKVMNGALEDWIAAGYPTSKDPEILAQASYTPSPRPDLLASFEDVSGGGLQVVDARSAAEYEEDHVPGAISIPSDEVLDGRGLAGEETLRMTFATLRPGEPVVVYSKNGGKASVVWYALTLMGYDARLYTWSDWLKGTDEEPSSF